MNSHVRIVIVVLLAASLAACGTAETKLLPSSGTLLPNTKLVVSPSIAYTVEQLTLTALAAGALYLIYDPLAPNWQIEEKALGDETYYLSLRAKSFRIGGDGEALRIIRRRALQLQHEKGYTAYRLLDYSEGIESSTPLTHRVSEATIQLVGIPGAPR